MKFKLISSVLLWLVMGTISNVFSAQNVSVIAPLFSDIVENVEKEAALNGRDMAGVVIESEMDFFDFASFEVLENGVSEWILDVESIAALGLCVYFNDFHIPSGGSLLFQSEAGVFSTLYQEGPFRSEENNAHGRWASGDIPGDQIRIIYRQAASSIGSARLGIMGIGYFVIL